MTMKRLAALAVPALALTGCGFAGGLHAPAPGYAHAAPHAAAVHYGYEAGPRLRTPVPVQNPCAYGGPCPSGGYSTVGASHAVQPGAHAYGTHARHSAPGYGLRGYSNPYANRAYAYTTIGAQLFDVDRDYIGLQGRLGYQSASVVGAEIEGSFGLSDETETVLGGELETEIETQFAGFATARLPLGERFALRGRGGYHFTELDGTLTDAAGVETSQSETFDGFAWGAGAEFDLTPRSAIRADYTRYHYGSGGDALDSAALAYVHRF